MFVVYKKKCLYFALIQKKKKAANNKNVTAKCFWLAVIVLVSKAHNITNKRHSYIKKQKKQTRISVFIKLAIPLTRWIIKKKKKIKNSVMKLSVKKICLIRSKALFCHWGLWYESMLGKRFVFSLVVNQKHLFLFNWNLAL